MPKAHSDVYSFIATHNKSLNTGLAIRSRSLFNSGCSQPVKQTFLREANSFQDGEAEQVCSCFD